jgi:predicted ATPase/DNA-binding CsgD family transcriptional regulator
MKNVDTSPPIPPAHLPQKLAPYLGGEQDCSNMVAIGNTHNLPLFLSTFIGREKELVDIHQWLATHRLVTLTGAGGCGKTRLAVQTASALLSKFAGGVWLVEFAPVADPMFVVQIVAAALGVGEQPARSLAETLADHLRRRPTLLIFDNCEHLLAACAQLATTFLQRCPDLHILATSREPLGVAGEVAWVVPSLSLPEPQPWQDPASSKVAISVYEQSEAVRLFVARATTVSPSLSLSIENGAWVAEICRRLDGMPLAIELAAARVRALSVREIAQRLDDRFRLLTAGSRTAPPRQQTLTATLDWSYRLLDEAERKVLQRLAVFAGGCTLIAAEAVCADETVGADAVLDVLAHLVDKSLVVADHKEEGMRYHLLETIRQYALEKLLESGEMDQVRERHCAYFVVWAEQAQTHPYGPSQLAWLGRYEVEHDNLRLALEWCRGDEGRAVAGLRLAVACAPFWRVYVYPSEGIAHLAVAFTAAGAQAPTMVRAWALSHLANLNYLRSDYRAMRLYAEEALSIWRGLGQAGRSGLAFALDLLGELATEVGDYEQAPVFLQEALDIYRELDDLRGIGDILMQFGWTAIRTGHYTAAAAHLQEFLVLAQGSGDVRSTAFALAGLGELAMRQGRHERAVELLEESLRLNRSRGDRWCVGTVLGSLGWVALVQHDYARMRANLGESLAIRLEIGDRGGIAWCLEKLAEAARVQGETATAFARIERYQAAARIFGAAAALRGPIKSVIDPVDQPGYEHNLAALRRGLGGPAFAAAWAEGEAMALTAVVDYALAAPVHELNADPSSKGSASEQLGGLSAREREVVVLIAQGKSNREIAAALTVNLKTVETYVTRILNKLGFDSRVQVATWALERGLSGSSHSMNS